MSYRAPVRDMLFVMKELAGIAAVAELPGHQDAGYDTAAAVLEECAKLNQDVVAPLNAQGDKNPSSFAGGTVSTSPGFKDAFRQFTAGGWQGLPHPVEFGGQGLPKLIHAACIEMANGANLSFALCPLLTDGAIEALLTAGSDEQKALYIPRLIDGRWTGTMNLTEAQAGSDLSMVREPQPDGSFRLFGTKIFITYGEHDMAENIVHLVLARVTGAPDGVKGISLFVVPKFLIDASGTLGARNDEGTTAIQANDLVGRKTSRDGGAVARALIGQIEHTEHALAQRGSATCGAMHARLGAARQALLEVVDFVCEQSRGDPNAVYAGSVPYLMLAGNVVAGWQMARALIAAEDRLAAGEDGQFMRAKITTARFYADHILSRAPGLRDSIVEGAAGVTEMALEAF